MKQSDVAARLGRLWPSLADAGCDALLVTNLVNVRYLTGFTGSAGLLLLLPDESVLTTDGRYRDQAAEQLAAAGVNARVEVQPTLAGQHDVLAAAARGIGRLGLEADSVTWAQQRRLASNVFGSAELVATEGLIEDLRRVKDAGEIERMAEAARIADEALAAVLPLLGQGVTEREVALGLDYEMRRLGADGSSFETIVASGPNGAKPHARPTERRVEPGELVVIDFGARVDGYCSDMTRTLCVGEPADDTALRMVAVVKESQREGVAAVKAGARGRDVDQTCRAVIADAGWGDAFIHGTGHGVGLDIHEAPRVASTSEDVLATGHVVTVEPGVYLAEHGGVRIEDTVVVTDDGCIVLTNAPKDLVV
ncbi:MAG TPA: aminopeptidase P family protein [Acidimicrobiales bacterium]|jgi:Xaa-Pro aminopeptidase|nr:aminopeptidase P family protein [Acidimicrobiales bacterium]